MPSRKARSLNTTNRLEIEERQTLIIPALGTFDTRFDVEHVTYHPVPSTFAGSDQLPMWRVKIKFGGVDQRVVTGLDLYGDTIIGRGSGAPDSPDIDLTNLDALKLGVSRRHALLRPTVNKLYVIDLESTNGTFVNAIQVSRGMAQVIRNHDGLAFAGLTCVVEVVASPAYPLSVKEPSEDNPAEVAATLKIGKPKAGMQTIVGVKLEFPPKPDQDKKS